MRSIVSIAAVTATFVSAAVGTSAAAQREPAPTGAQRMAAQRAETKLNGAGDKSTPATSSSTLKSGDYVMSLTPAVIDGHPARKSAETSISDVKLTTNGNSVDVTGPGGGVLHGTLNGRAFKASGQSGDGTLTLTGMGFSNSVTGSFTMKLNGGHAASGNFALNAKTAASGSGSGTANLKDYQPKKPATSDCNWWCTFKGWISL
jgi:hypothetical protein